MKHLTLGLSGLLAVQLTLAGGLFWHQNLRSEAYSQPQSLLSFSKPGIDRVIIGDGERSVTLAKQNGQWQLPELDGLPVNEGKLTALLDKLEGLSGQWPVATTTASHKRFGVDETLYQRRVELYQGDSVAGELYLGSAPGFRKTHTRAGDSNAIYALELNTYELPTDGNDWLDRRLLAARDIDQISGPDYAIQKGEDGWRFLAESGQGESAETIALDAKKADQLAAALASLQVQTLVASPTGDTQSTDAITLNVAGPDTHWTYHFQRQGDHYQVRRSDREQVFSISKYDYERIAQVGLPQLAVDSTPAAPEPTQQAPSGQPSSNS